MLTDPVLSVRISDVGLGSFSFGNPIEKAMFVSVVLTSLVFPEFTITRNFAVQCLRVCNFHNHLILLLSAWNRKSRDPTIAENQLRAEPL